MANNFMVNPLLALQQGGQVAEQLQNAPLRRQQLEQQGQFNVLKQRGLQQEADIRTDAQKNLSLLNTAQKVSVARDEDIIPLLQSQISRVTELGGNPEETRRALALAETGDLAGVRRGAENLVNIGIAQGELKAAPTVRFSSLQQKVAAEGLDPNTPEGQARAREITQGSRTDPSLKPSDQQILSKANEGQLASASFANRVLSANDNLATLESKEGFDPTSIQTAIFEAIPGGNLALSEDEQSYAQSKRDFITAILRKESGAAIGKDEFANEDRKFFPQVGDKASVLKQKAAGRKRTFENLKNQSKGVFDVQAKQNISTGELNAAEQAELQQLRAELGQ